MLTLPYLVSPYPPKHVFGVFSITHGTLPPYVEVHSLNTYYKTRVQWYRIFCVLLQRRLDTSAALALGSCSIGDNTSAIQTPMARFCDTFIA